MNFAVIMHVIMNSILVSPYIIKVLEFVIECS